MNLTHDASKPTGGLQIGVHPTESLMHHSGTQAPGHGVFFDWHTELASDKKRSFLARCRLLKDCFEPKAVLKIVQPGAGR